MTVVAFHSTHRKGYQSRLLVVLSKGGWCNFWGLLDCDDQRSPWWANSVGPQRDTVMISMSFNSYACLAIFFIIPVLFCFVRFCFWTRKCTYCMSVSCVWLYLPYVSLQSNWEWKPSFRLLFEDFCLWSRYNNINYGAWHVYKPLFGSSVADLPVPKFYFQPMARRVTSELYYKND